MSGSERSRAVLQEVEVDHAASHRADGQPALITGRCKHPRQAEGRWNDDIQLITTSPPRFRDGSRVRKCPR